ncbi:MAG TPA: hypothetical protein VFK04_12490 [Gemmatimonadaceae bacterium]|jgi:hypothetical protein|nr:hypothetical protein [Gemmatimonadaceae bacterium]
MRAALVLPRAVVALTLALAIFACVDGDTSLRPDTTAGRGGGNGAAGLLVGQWSHSEVFTDDNGAVHGSKTVWRFDEDSTARRLVIATDVAAGFADTVAADARWEATGTQLTITFQPPDTGTVTFTYEVHLSSLTLGGVEFVRDD